MKYPCSLEILFYVTCCLWHPACEGKPIIICTDVLWWYQCRDLQSHSSPCVLTPSCRDKAGTCSLHWAACPELCYAPPSTHCYTWQPITCNARTWNIHLHESPDSDMLWPPSNCAGPSLRALNYSRQPNFSSLEAKPSHTDALEPGKMDAPHTVGQNIPLSRAIDRTNIKDSPLARASLSLSPQYVKAHPLDLETPDPLLTPVVTSNIQRLQLPGHETAHSQTHAHIGHACARTWGS